MTFYQLLTFTLLLVIPFFPKQLDERITYLIIAYAVFLLPVFVKTILSIFHLPGVLRPPGGWTLGIVFFFILFLISSTVSTIFSIDQKRSILSLVLYFSYFVIFICSKEIFNNLKSKQRLAMLLIAIVAVLSFISIYNTIILKYANKETVGASFMWIYYGHNHLSALLLFVIPLCFYFLKQYWSTKNNFQFVVLFTICFLLFAMITTLAMASIISLLIAFCISAILFRFFPKRLMVLTIGLSAFFILGLSTGVLIRPEPLGIPKYEQDRKIPLLLGMDNRANYWLDAIENGFANKFFGSGLDTFRNINFRSASLGFKTYYAHNFFLQMFSDAGFLGLWTSQALILSVLWRGWKRIGGILDQKERLFLVVMWMGLLASMFNALVDFDWQLPAVFFMFWLLAGLI